MRVQIPCWHDRWMMGDRYGAVVRVIQQPEGHRDGSYALAHVKLDKSGRTISVPLDDCKIVETG